MIWNQEDGCLMGQDYNLSCLNISLCCSHEDSSPPNPCECTIVCKTRASHASPGAAYLLSRFYPRPIFIFPQLDLNSYYVSARRRKCRGNVLKAVELVVSFKRVLLIHLLKKFSLTLQMLSSTIV
ncbi:hypothetical protein P8452_08064 [Trifolium repens]|nr:hypothetical protein P8452_08064 [Trifolium repens]